MKAFVTLVYVGLQFVLFAHAGDFVLKSCPQPSRPPGAKIKVYGRCCQAGTMFKYRCRQGLVRQGRGVIHCNDNGQWSRNPPNCRRKFICLDPPEIENGYFKLTKTYRRLRGSGPGDRARYFCKPGYHLINHTFFHDIVCTSRQSWSEQSDTCTKLYCYMPKAPRNGFIIAENKTRFEMGERIRYVCRDNYELVDVKERVCHDISKGWDGWEATCREIRCPNPGHPENGRRIGGNFSIGERVSFVCSGGLNLKGSQIRMCKLTRRWSGTLTTCQTGKTYCPDPGIPIGGAKHGRRYNLGDKVKFQCDIGFFLAGSTERECLINRAWSGSRTTCNYRRGRDDPEEAALRLIEDFDSLAMFSIDADNSTEVEENATDHQHFGRSLAVSHKSGLDLYFVFDVSGSINQSDFKLAREFACVLMDKYEITPGIAMTASEAAIFKLPSPVDLTFDHTNLLYF